ETWSLAQEAVPGLQRLGRPGVGDDAVYPAPDALHGPVVLLLAERHQLLEGDLGPASRLATRLDVAVDLAPAGTDQVDVLSGVDLVDADVEVVHPLALPAGRQGPRPVRIGRAVAAVVDVGRGALEDRQVLGVSGQERDALHRSGAGADHRHPLVGQTGELGV